MTHLGMTNHLQVPFSITCELSSLLGSLGKPSLGSLLAFPNKISVKVWNPESHPWKAQAEENQYKPNKPESESKTRLVSSKVT